MVMSVELDREVTIYTTHSHDYMALQNAWAKVAGNHSAGEDIVIGVVDTGIYPDHPSFAATDGVKPYGPHPTFKGVCRTDPRVPNGFCNGKIVGAQMFFESSKASGIVNATDPDVNSPLDGNGHGTHCAGTAAGNYGVPVVVNGANYGLASGAAPRARLSIYKALTSDGKGRTSDLLAAVDQAVADGVHVLSLSLGPNAANVGSVTFTDTFEIACLGALKAGVYVVHAAGNTGPGTSTISSWSPWLTSVGASTMDRTYPNRLYTGDGKTVFGQGLAPPTPGTQNYPLIRAVDAKLTSTSFVNTDFDCADPTVLNKKQIQGKILVCMWNGVPSFMGESGTLSRVAAQAMGAVGVVLVTMQTYDDPHSPSTFDFQDFPGISIWGAKAMESFVTYLQTANAPTGRIGGGTTAEYTGLPPVVAPFSSRGPDFYYGLDQPSATDQPVADVLKPTIVAPGVDIWSAWSPLSTIDKLSLFKGEKFCMISGTSMATPHMAGVAAIVRQAHPDWTPSMIASALATTAIPLDSLDNPLIAYDEDLDQFGQKIKQIKRPGNAFDFGGGFVDAATAIDPGLVFDATYSDYIKFLCTIKDLTPALVKAVTFQDCPANPGLASDLNLPSITIGTLAKTRVVPRMVKNVGPLETYTAVINSKNADVDITVDPPTFTIAPGATQLITFTLKAVKNAVYVNQTSFGRIYLTGNLGHVVKIPVSVTYRQV
ncbi:hypothetical protein M758_2G100300 [Ceratodon purpureus]|nr:hypothetical protein M758_2G100300 [Ceratodon purpureus]KAG0626070.1 hypothetical protein M758_2G100300 [Ceratodon purpureus]KAG0626076.1 hypothetical protein M758_2G100300 [Ceratodon purpureus]